MIPIGIGFSRILLGNTETPLNFVPVDYISNSLITAIAQSAKRFQKQEQRVTQVPIFNYGVDKSTCIKIREVMSHGMEVCARVPMENMVWYPGTSITASVLLYKLYFYVLQLLPGFFAELLLITMKYKFRWEKKNYSEILKY